MPSMRKLLIKSPGLPGGRFCGEPPPPAVSLPRSGANGSRRGIFSRTATGVIVGAAAGVWTSGFTGTGTDGLGTLAVEIAAVPGGALLGTVVGLAALTGARGAFETDAALEADFAGELVIGFAVAFGVAGAAGDVGAEPDAGVGAVGAGLMAEVADGTGF